MGFFQHYTRARAPAPAFLGPGRGAATFPEVPATPLYSCSAALRGLCPGKMNDQWKNRHFGVWKRELEHVEMGLSRLMFNRGRGLCDYRAVAEKIAVAKVGKWPADQEKLEGHIHVLVVFSSVCITFYASLSCSGNFNLSRFHLCV